MEPGRVFGRVPRGPAQDRRGEAERPGDRGRRAGAHREGRRPDGGVEGERRRREEGIRARAEEAGGPEDGGEEDGGEETRREEARGAQEGRRGVVEPDLRPASDGDRAAISR